MATTAAPPTEDKQWFALEGDAVAGELGVDIRAGLAPAEAAARPPEPDPPHDAVDAAPVADLHRDRVRAGRRDGDPQAGAAPPERGSSGADPDDGRAPAGGRLGVLHPDGTMPLAGLGRTLQTWQLRLR